MSGPFFFGLHDGQLSRREVERRDRIAARHGAYGYVQVRLDGRWRGWFEGPNLGAPHDRAMAARVLREVEREGGA